MEVNQVGVRAAVAAGVHGAECSELVAEAERDLRGRRPEQGHVPRRGRRAAGEGR